MDDLICVGQLICLGQLAAFVHDPIMTTVWKSIYMEIARVSCQMKMFQLSLFLEWSFSVMKSICVHHALGVMHGVQSLEIKMHAEQCSSFIRITRSAIPICVCCLVCIFIFVQCTLRIVYKA